jgi:hemerythrin-like domain-containing protein
MFRDPSLIPLSHDHQHALALCVQTRRAVAKDVTVDGLREVADRIIAQFDAEMRVHFEREEKYLFPAMSACESTRDLVIELTGEHGRITALAGALRERADRDLILHFADLLTQHVRKEEGILFEEAQRLLTREELDRIGQLLAAPL